MGAKTTAKSRLKGTAYKCDLCGRKFMSLNNLKTHQRSVHNLQPKKPQPKPVVTKSKPKNVVKEKATPEASSQHLQSSPIDNVSKDSTPSKIEDVNVATSEQAVVEFECPKCFRKFQTYFSSLKHIQKFHCINKKGVKVSPNSPSLIQPVRIELCQKCKKKVHSISTHLCDLSTLKSCLTDSLLYTCTACDQSFNTLRNFDSHVVWLHADDVESIFFPTANEFKAWKEEMETQTNVQYTDVDKYESKFFYHCSYKMDKTSSNSNNICPSTLVVQEFTKGIQVHLYKKHYKHCFVDYNLCDKYKKYSINTYLKTSRDKQAAGHGEDDTYSKFKTTMEKIVVDAAKLDQASLKILVSHASDMVKVLDDIEQQNKEKENGSNVSKNMTDTQITQALEDTTEKISKRKLDVDLIVEEVPTVKRTRNNQVITNTADTSSPKIINAFSLANNANALEDINKENSIIVAQDSNSTSNTETVKQKDVIDANAETNVQINQKPLDQSLSSFNESYADFLERNFKAVAGKNKKTRLNKKKTSTNNNNTTESDKIGNTKPDEQINANENKSVTEPSKNIAAPSPVNNKVILGSKRNASPSQTKKNILENKKIADQSPNDKSLIEINKNLLVPKKRTVSPKSRSRKTPNTTQIKKNAPETIKMITSPAQINKALLNQNKKNKNDKKKNIMKTKIGQFTKSTTVKKVIPKSKPQAKPKIASKPLTSPRLSFEKPKVFVEYEVQEQEDDCNILILKI